MAGMRNRIFIGILLLVVMALVILLVVGCPQPLKFIKFKMDNKPNKEFMLNLNHNMMLLKLHGVYWTQGPGLGFYLKIFADYSDSMKTLKFKPENISVSFSDIRLIWYNPKHDSLSTEISDSSCYFSLYFWRGSLTKDNILYLKNTDFPLKISLDNFIYVNDTAILIDTIYATSPKLEYYKSWRK